MNREPDGTCFRAMILAIALVALGRQHSAAQLAITEVMSSATNRLGASTVVPGPDFWELTNFGDVPIDLNEYSFNDRNGPTPETSVFTNLVIPARGVIIFAEDKGGYSPETFRQWWGLSSQVPVVLYKGHGLAALGDDVRLWSSNAGTDDVLVHAVSFPQAVPGFTFVYNPASDRFDAVSSINLNGTFLAATSDDVGSPGTPPAPVALAITAPPTNAVANEGDAVTFSVGKRGLPPPSFQWFFNDTPIPGAHFASLVLTNLQSANQGAYRVVLSNYFSQVQSTSATLQVNRLPTPPRWLSRHSDLTVFENQSPTFVVAATGVPQPTYQWYFRGIAIPDAQQNSYTVGSAQIRDSGTYSVVARNPSGAVTNAAQLIVTPRANLRITEVMTSRTTNNPVPGRDDWWELTSFETDPTRRIDLFGYRFDDGITLRFAWTNREHVFIEPGKSVIFVKNLSSEAFRSWWGPANLPVDLQIITYQGGGLGLNPVDDVIYLWNPGATEDADVVDKANWFTETLVPGVSYSLDFAHPEVPCCDEFSIEGVQGAVAAASGGDIGSPGYLGAPKELRILSFQRQTDGCFLTWRSVFGGHYVVQHREHLTSGNWLDLIMLSPTGTTTSYLDPTALGSTQKFYRVVLQPTP